MAVNKNEEKVDEKVQNDKRGKSKRTRSNSKRGANSKRNTGSNNVSRNGHAFERGCERTPYGNDVSWYSKNPELMRAASSLPFSYTTGQKLPFKGTTSVPGILRVTYTPNMGYSYIEGSAPFEPDAFSNSAINLAAKSVYSYTVHANSRTQSYDATDEMLIILAGSQIFAMIAHAIRTYGVLKTYAQQNYYMPKAIIRALGFDYADLLKNMSRMWFDINQMIAQVSQIWIPNTFPITKRWFWMNSNIFTDAPGVKSQMYLFVPDRFYIYDETSDPNGGKLVMTNWNPDARYTWDEFTTIVNEAINALLNSQDRGIIMGDILKAYGADKIYTLTEIDSSYTLLPVYDTEVLTQIENSMSQRNIPSEVRQSEDGYLYMYADREDSAPNPQTIPMFQSVLNYHTSQEPTPDMNMVATRLKNHSVYVLHAPDSGQILNVVANSDASEIVTGYDVYWYGNDGVLYTRTVQSVCSSTDVDDTIKYLSLWSSFDWAPWLYFIDNTTYTDWLAGKIPAPDITYTFGDYDQYALLSNIDLAEMHKVAIFSELDVPTM